MFVYPLLNHHLNHSDADDVLSNCSKASLALVNFLTESKQFSKSFLAISDKIDCILFFFCRQDRYQINLLEYNIILVISK
jgi:hypothetical protein